MPTAVQKDDLIHTKLLIWLQKASMQGGRTLISSNTSWYQPTPSGQVTGKLVCSYLLPDAAFVLPPFISYLGSRITPSVVASVTSLWTSCKNLRAAATRLDELKKRQYLAKAVSLQYHFFTPDAIFRIIKWQWTIFKAQNIYDISSFASKSLTHLLIQCPKWTNFILTLYRLKFSIPASCNERQADAKHFRQNSSPCFSRTGAHWRPRRPPPSPPPRWGRSLSWPPGRALPVMAAPLPSSWPPCHSQERGPGGVSLPAAMSFCGWSPGLRHPLWCFTFSGSREEHLCLPAVIQSAYPFFGIL